MPLTFNLALLAQESANQTSSYITAAIVMAAIIVPAFIGNFVAKSLRMADYGWKIGLILSVLCLSGVVVWKGFARKEDGSFTGLKLGVDLKGGVILIYEVDEEATKAANQGEMEDIDMKALVQNLARRINPGGMKEIVVREYGVRQVEIIIPDVDPVEIKRIKDSIVKAGALVFRIVANDKDHDYIIKTAREQAGDPLLRRKSLVGDAEEGEYGRWVRVGRDEPKNAVGGIIPLKEGVAYDIIRDAITGEMIDVPQAALPSDTDPVKFERWLEEQGIKEVDVLMAIDDGYDVTGDNLGIVRASFENTRPCVNFTMTGTGAGLFSGLTGSNLPTGDFHRRLGIILDGELLSAPRIQSTISDQGRITGRFTQDEVDFLVHVLNAGKLPATLEKEPLSENQIGSMLGAETIRRGSIAIVISIMVVLVFILIYYRFSGLVACGALLTNLLLILALMILVKATLTLPGLAGLVLTVGMSVDANVLIFERIREELAKGSALRMAIRNGFDRATTTIVDANLTTLITAVVLYVIGTDQIRGFAVTLILGILMSMFTAIFCARVIFEIAERKRLVTNLSMAHVLGVTKIDFIGKRFVAAVLSTILIVVGLVGVALRNKQIFDIDFLGGTSVVMLLEEGENDSALRDTLDKAFKELQQEGTTSIQYTLNRVVVEGQPENTVWKVDSSLQDVERLQAVLHDNLKLASYSLKFDALEEYQEEIKTSSDNGDDAATTPPSPKVDPGKIDPDPAKAESNNDETKKDDKTPPEKDGASVGRSDEFSVGCGPQDEPKTEKTDEPKTEKTDEPKTEKTGEPKTEKTGEPKTEKTGEPKTEKTGEPKTERTDEPKTEKTGEPKTEKTDEPKTEKTGEPKTKKTGEPKTEKTDEPKTEKTDEPKTEKTDEPKTEKTDDPKTTTEPKEGVETKPRVLTRTRTTLEFGYPINAPTLVGEIKDAAEELEFNAPEVLVEPVNPTAGWDTTSNAGFNEWKLVIGAPRSEADPILNRIKTSLEDTPVWQSSSKIGGKVAGDTQSTAIAALLTSLIGIVGYIWLRFQRVTFGLAAVVALVHDVLITLGAIAISYWFAGIFGFLLIEEFKISLPVVAAFLTIIGYSLNDTIVVFDRIREVRGRSPNLTGEMVNTSINQTLSRTLLTSFTTLVVVLILYFMGGQGIHGFAFSLVIGVLAGTYSSIFVASPALLWMTNRQQAASGKATA